jgi:hypothetical protein
MTDGNSKLILIATQNGTTVADAHPFAVEYLGTNWSIVNVDLGVMPTNSTFNILVVAP